MQLKEDRPRRGRRQRDGGRMQLRTIGAALLAALALPLASCDAPHAVAPSGPAADWPSYGGQSGGGHYSPANNVTPANVAGLETAWTYHIGMIDAPGMTSPTFEATPIVAEGRMYVCSGVNRIAALDPETGRQIWVHDASVDTKGAYLLNCRGVAYHRDPQAKGVCSARIFAGTLDARLIALDAADGKPCPGFGNDGSVALRSGLGHVNSGDIGVSSPPVIVGDKVVVGGRVADNMNVDISAGVVRAYDVHDGRLVWAWNPIPPGRSDAEAAASGSSYIRSTPNVWAPMSVDPKRNLLFLPMGNAGPDHVSAGRHGLDYYSSSVVALDANSGKPRWRFQTVHRDIWDYDVPSQPTLVDLPSPQGEIPALVQATKQGHIFVLNRETGQPVFPVEERPVPQDGALPGEKLSPTQPFPVNPAFIVRRDLSENDMWGFTPIDRAQCRRMFREANWKGVFTPVSTRGTIAFPSFMGATNWGGVAVDPVSKIMVVNTTQVPAILTMIPRAEIAAHRARGESVLPATGAPYGNTMKPMLSSLGAPCIKPPWGTLLAIDLKTGKRLWEKPLGSLRDTAPFPLWFNWGVPSLGGPTITASGLVFIGATTDNYLRAIDIRTGEVLWKGRLPAGGQATPMSYRLPDGRQYVVIAAGGHRYLGTKAGDSLVAYALPAPKPKS
ncbi:pyrroloquinoline quinone-dependent dehydrogenase [Sphingobium estronivorans]|uniref:pyrroloquinoline quinone-dependent dehydrogenase n=1 Tax=Sphingobium estronivorans TaxID=1577690 RepID=UPI001F07CBED|nr:pyrroloquinoline quinone-dependent dehydrogenase [Sphingobium estronivorans]